MGQTANLNLPYPENTDPLADMANAIQALANGIDAGVGAAVIRATGIQNIPTGAPQRIDMAETVMANAATPDLANDRITVTSAGLYLVVFRCSLQTTSMTGDMSIEVRVNGNGAITPARTSQKFSGGWPLINAVGFALLNAGDYVEGWVAQSTGGTVPTLNSDNWCAYLSALRLV